MVSIVDHVITVPILWRAFFGFSTFPIHIFGHITQRTSFFHHFLVNVNYWLRADESD